MTDEDQVERLLRASPTMDSRYEPALAELLDAERGAPVVGVLRWRYGSSGLARLVPLVLLGAAILVAATVLIAGGVQPRPPRRGRALSADSEPETGAGFSG